MFTELHCSKVYLTVRNEPPLDLVNRNKPKENKNVIRTLQNIFYLEDCLRLVQCGVQGSPKNMNIGRRLQTLKSLNQNKNMIKLCKAFQLNEIFKARPVYQQKGIKEVMKSLSFAFSGTPCVTCNNRFQIMNNMCDISDHCRLKAQFKIDSQ